MKVIITLSIILLLLSSCRKVDPILGNYLEVEGDWEISAIKFTDDTDVTTLMDMQSTLSFKGCLNGTEIQDENCLAVQLYEGKRVEMTYNMSFDRVSFHFEGNDPQMYPKYFVGHSVAYDILTLEDNLFVIKSNDFYNFETLSTYDEVQITMKK